MPISNDWVKEHKKKQKNKPIDDFTFIEPHLTQKQKDKYQAVRLRANHQRNNQILEDFKVEMIEYHSKKLEALKKAHNSLWNRFKRKFF